MNNFIIALSAFWMMFWLLFIFNCLTDWQKNTETLKANIISNALKSLILVFGCALVLLIVCLPIIVTDFLK